MIKDKREKIKEQSPMHFAKNGAAKQHPISLVACYLLPATANSVGVCNG